MATLKFSATLSKSDPQTNAVLIVGQTKHLTQISWEIIKGKLEPRVDCETYLVGVSHLHPSPTDSCSLWLNNATVAALPTKISRHNTPSRGHALTKVIKSCMAGGDEYIVVVCERADVLASACAVARALPLYCGKSNTTGFKRVVTVEFVLASSRGEEVLTDADVEAISVVAHGVRLAAKITDMPCSLMHTDAFLEEIRAVGDELGITPLVIRGEELEKNGFGGIYGVGKAAVHQPALVVLSHKPQGAIRNIAWVGKGIVYDTGGLCIKSKTGMCGMKRDCGGAAAVLGAFFAAVKLGLTENLHAIFCLAENAVGPTAQRPDDIVTMYSGRTVEVNNTDAEGRLVLGDGVSYALKDLKCDTIVDMATLTGAQGIATGKYHAAILTNSEDMEDACVQAGLNSGDMVHPVPFTPELHFSEFSSVLADMKNSVADRSNAQVSCAGLFIFSHIGFDFPGTWLHIDMATPVHMGERSTGYGVALLVTLFGSMSVNDLVRTTAPVSACDGMDTVDNKAAKKIRLN
ncbi:probable aminopeptidase NPEPL1 [Pomacea canaliculata]|nr:probable aminopeptidase NPEPL1 [Pomacea canaliculata]XP_025115025.1 probable aminopeptidase NPEPL1 [Pomacea canaliculata]